jgi:ATP-binding cassette subfamily C (CFTR/MRP) protein 1
VIGAIKNVKMLGLQQSLESYIKELREGEILLASKVRWLMVAYNASANALGIFTPVLTLVLFAILAETKGTGLDTETAFTTMAILGMVTHPANMVMTIIPRAIASFSSFERIQTFLLAPDILDFRVDIAAFETNSVPTTQQKTAIRFENVTIERSRPILKDIEFDITEDSFVMLAGPTAVGKTTMVKAMLGELTPNTGTIFVRTKRIAYCSQSTWLPSTTIKDAIQSFNGTGEVDVAWYDKILGACCLYPDLRDMPHGDETTMGSKGMNISGGQRQRVVSAIPRSQESISILTS